MTDKNDFDRFFEAEAPAVRGSTTLMITISYRWYSMEEHPIVYVEASGN